jgi:hypothetical protein
MNATVDKKLFTVEEANQRLPLVRAIVGDIVELYRDVHERRDRLVKIRERRGDDDSGPGALYDEELSQIETDLEKDIARLGGFVEELRELSVELKDPNIGLIDFRSLMDGREVYLCWKHGEDEIAYWHELAAGFSGRQSLLERSVPNPVDADSDSTE